MTTLIALAAMILGAGVAFGETVRWKGEIVLKAPVLIGRGETLVVDPGTRIVMDAPDADGDGVGDVWISVLGGSVEIRGTADRPVVVTGRPGSPLKASWKELLIEESPSVVITHTLFERAFWPLQIHSSVARVEFCTFRDNLEGGLRFRQGTMTIRGNSFAGAGIGIRYHDSGPVIAGNAFSCDKGIFFTDCVREGSIAGNTFACREYDLQVGFFQEGPVTVGGNVFVRPMGGRLRDRIYDRAMDADLQEVLFSDRPVVRFSGEGR
jgi:hypothetical protein